MDFYTNVIQRGNTLFVRGVDGNQRVMDKVKYSPTLFDLTNKGETGYKIKKLELFPTQPGIANVENVVQVFTVPYTETNTSATPNFDNPTLIGAAYFQDNASSAVPSSKVVVVDNVVPPKLNSSPINVPLALMLLEAVIGDSNNILSSTVIGLNPDYTPKEPVPAFI